VSFFPVLTSHLACAFNLNTAGFKFNDANFGDCTGYCSLLEPGETTVAPATPEYDEWLYTPDQASAYLKKPTYLGAVATTKVSDGGVRAATDDATASSSAQTGGGDGGEHGGGTDGGGALPCRELDLHLQLQKGRDGEKKPLLMMITTVGSIQSMDASKQSLQQAAATSWMVLAPEVATLIAVDGESVVAPGNMLPRVVCPANKVGEPSHASANLALHGV
jgi:hypothetical protein